MTDADRLSSAVPADVATAGEPSPSRRLEVIAIVVLALGHFFWITSHLAPAIMSPDANGYVAQARLIAEKGRTSFVTGSPVQFVGMHWLETDAGVFHSRYPAGLPLLFAGAWKIHGLDSAVWINPLLASGTLVLVFLLARRLVPAAYALVAALVVATVPVTNQHALDADAHIAATFFLVGGVLALLRFADERTRGTGLLAGVLLGAVPTIRYPEAIVGLTIALWLLWRIRPLARVWPAVVGAALPIGALCAHNATAYGAFWKTGYALTNEQTGFGLSYFAGHALPYLQALGGQGLALFFAFGTAGLAALVADQQRRSEGALFAGIVVPLVLLYMAYYFGGGGPGGASGNLRFLIPTFPFFAVAGVWLLARVGEQLGTAGRAAVMVVAALQLTIALGASTPLLTNAKNSLRAAGRARELADHEIPAGSVIIVDRQLAESLDAVGRWKLVEENFIAAGGLGGGPGGGGMGFPGPGGMRGPGGRASGGGLGGPRPFAGGAGGPPDMMAPEDTPSPQQRGKNRAQQERYAGLRGEERRARIWEDLLAWANGKPIFWYARSLEAVSNLLPAGADYRSVAEIDAPTMIGPGGGAGGPGGMAGGGPGMMPGGLMGGGRGAMPPGRGMAGGNFGPPGMGPGRGAMMAAPGAANVNAKLRVVRIDLPGSAK